jgi:predicted TIM-barrel fold metal-dependent hydrolase
VSSAAAAAAIAEVVAGLPLLDNHCHGVLQSDPTPAQFAALLDEGGNGAAPGTTRWSTPVGLALRRHCAPVLDLDPFAAPEAYLQRRHELGAAEVNRRLLRAAGTAGLLLDTGFRSEEIATPDQMAAIVGVPTWEIVRLESVAEEVAQSGVSAERYPSAFAEALAARATDAVGLKTVLAYRGGFAIDPGRPTDDQVVEAAGRWLAEIEGGTTRLTDPTLLRFGIWAGADLARPRRLPLQFHVGYGDTDLTLHRTDPSLLTDLIRALGAVGVEVVLLHCYPYHRQAAYLADAFPNVSFDLGLALTFAGASAHRIVAEAMEIAPFTKQLYSSDGFGAAELHYLGARHFRDGLGRVLGGWLADGTCNLEEATRIATQIGSGNARRLYPL